MGKSNIRIKEKFREREKVAARAGPGWWGRGKGK